MLSNIQEFIRKKEPAQTDSEEIKHIKGLIRRGEAKAAARYCGIPEERLHFLDLPFYETGRVKKKPLSQQDIDITVDLLRSVKPHQVYAAGDLSDPHGTHRVCLKAIFEALKECRDDEWTSDCYVWLYRGAWQELGDQRNRDGGSDKPAGTGQKAPGYFQASIPERPTVVSRPR
ncbi:MAG: PIG-L family deacetylase [Balneolaceae bacterium]|nr:PIG-L family deacetylase [Balneolaceae bacterium]